MLLRVNVSSNTYVFLSDPRNPASETDSVSGMIPQDNMEQTIGTDNGFDVKEWVHPDNQNVKVIGLVNHLAAQ